MIKYLWGLINRYTTGVPFIIWGAYGLIMAAFLIIFRNEAFFDFRSLIYVLAFSVCWFLVSDILKKKEIFNKRLHFWADSLVYATIFSLIFYFTEGITGELFFIFSLVAISAPLFGSTADALALLVLVGLASFWVNILLAIQGKVKFDYYHIGILILVWLIYFAIAGILKFFQSNYLKELMNAKKYQQDLAETNKELEIAKEDVEGQVREQMKKLREQNISLESTRKAITNILEDVSESERDLRMKTLELEKFQQAADVSFDHIVITDTEGIILYANRATEEITGYSKKEVIGSKSGKLWGNQMPREFYEKMWKTLKVEKSAYAGEATNRRKNGEKYLASIRISPILNKKGEIMFFVGAERDITEEREAQIRVIKHAAELQRANSRIEKEKERAESILQYLRSIGDCVIITDITGKVIFFNEAAEKITGVSGSEAMGKYSTDVLFIFDEKDSQSRRFVIKETLADKKNISKKIERFVIKRKDGSLLPVSFSASLIFNNDKQRQGIIMVIRDMTEERELEKTKDNFLSVAAHQLRTPLSGIRWNLEMLLEGDAGKLSKEAKEIVENINENNLRLVVLVNDLLNVSRINSGKAIESPRAVSAAETIDSVLKSGKGLASKNKIAIMFDAAKNKNLKVLISPERFFESIENVISNAVKYTGENGKVKIAVDKKKDKIQISIADNGIGIPEREQEKMFSKFFRAENAVHKDPEGSGLGLSVVKSFIEEAGGMVSFESQEGKGTTFFIILPEYSGTNQ